MVGIIAFAFLLVTLTVLIHFEGLQLLSRSISGGGTSGRMVVLLTIYAILALHVFEIAVWAGGYWFGDVVVNIGEFKGPEPFGLVAYMYFSFEAYSSLGMGDVLPLGEFRILAGLETLTGLIMIAWSGSFTYLSMERNWSRR